MINTLPKLYFVNDSDPVTVYTDASDFGIGAYICQTVNGGERPVAFMSKENRNFRKQKRNGQQ